VIGGCEEEDFPVLPELPVEIRYLSIRHNSSSNTLVANGVNQIKFEITAFDADQKKISFLSPATLNKIKITVNGSNPIGYPFLFKTTEMGTFTFDIKDLDQKSNLSGPIQINTIADRGYEPTTFQVIFHYISSGITEFQKKEIQSTLSSNLAFVNKAFMNLQNSKDPNAASAFVQFKMAELDPDGNTLALKGFHEIVSDKKSFGNYINSTIDELIWDNNFWTPKKYINVWIAKLDDQYSWAYYPDLTNSSQAFPNNTYGVVYNKDHINDPVVLSHELGHMLNLRHVFEDSCADPDFCSDTWAYKRKATDEETQWYLHKSTCDDITFLANNYMDYYPSQNNTFSLEQVSRMQFAISNCPFLPTEKNMLNGKAKQIPYGNLTMKRKDDRPWRVL
jgi:hypothetical protein